jgi:RNA polymerase sigma-70 factor (ECF subfamily)
MLTMALRPPTTFWQSDRAAICSPDDAPEAAAVRAQMRVLLEHEVDALPIAFRTVFVMRCIEDLSVAETAACLALPEATVRSRLFRARGMLRESLASHIDLAEREAFGFDGERCDRAVTRVLARVGESG